MKYLIKAKPLDLFRKDLPEIRSAHLLLARHKILPIFPFRRDKEPEKAPKIRVYLDLHFSLGFFLNDGDVFIGVVGCLHVQDVTLPLPCIPSKSNSSCHSNLCLRKEQSHLLRGPFFVALKLVLLKPRNRVRGNDVAVQGITKHH